MGAVFGIHQVAVGPSRIGIAHHDVSRHKLSTRQLQTFGLVLNHSDFLDGCVVANIHAALPQQVHQALNNGARSTHGRMHTLVALQGMDECVSGCH